MALSKPSDFFSKAEPPLVQLQNQEGELISDESDIQLHPDHDFITIPLTSIKGKRRISSPEQTYLIPAHSEYPEYEVILRPKRLSFRAPFDPSESSNSRDVSSEMPINHHEPVEPPTRPQLTPAQRIMAVSYRERVNKRSYVALLFFILACGGKIILGFGAGLAVQAAFTQPTPPSGQVVSGSVLAGIGAISVIFASLGFGASITRVFLLFGWTMKATSISAATLITAGDAISQYYFTTGDRVKSIRATFAPLAVGTALLAISLPNFVAYTELYRGRTIGIPLKKRPLVSLCCIGIANGLLFGGWVSGEHSDWPPAFNLAIMTAAIAVGYFGASLMWSDHLHRRAAGYEALLSAEQENESKQPPGPRNEFEKPPSEMPLEL